MPYQIGFMMIDSPLKAYRAKDENLSDNFYHYFKEESSNGSQIIIFENTDVPEVKDKIEEIDPLGIGDFSPEQDVNKAIVSNIFKINFRQVFNFFLLSSLASSFV
jgi:hypothetical protein